MLNFFKNYKYSKLLIVKFFELYSFYSLRSVLVLVFVLSLALSDMEAFKIYTTFVVCGDIISIIGAYFGDRLLTRRISFVIGAFFSIFGYFYSYLHFNFFGICIGLIFAGIGMGLTRCNTNVIINDYIQEEIEEDSRHNHNGVFHITTIIALLLGFIVNGVIVKYFDHRMIFGFSGLSMLISLLTFIFFELKKLKSEIIFTFFKDPELRNQKKNFFTNFDFNRFSKLFLSLSGAILFSGSLYYILEKFKENLLIKNIKILIVIMVVALSIFLLKKSKEYILKEKQGVWSLILYLPYYLIYMAFEKQLDMSFSLFLFRSVNRNIFGFEIPTANVTAIFSIVILLISIFFLKKSIYSYFKHNTTLILGFFLTMMHFFLNYAGSALAIHFNSKVLLIFPVLSLAFLAMADIFVVPRMYSLCRTIPEQIKSFSSSLMMLCHGSGFYIAGFLAQFAAIKTYTKKTPEIIVDQMDLISVQMANSIQSLEYLKIYEKSFKIFVVINLIIIISLLLINKSKIGLLLTRK